MPVSLRKDFVSNNQVGILPAPLPLGDMDPLKRMRSIRTPLSTARTACCR